MRWQAEAAGWRGQLTGGPRRPRVQGELVSRARSAGSPGPILAETGGGRTWLCAALPTPHTVVTTDSDPAG